MTVDGIENQVDSPVSYTSMEASKQPSTVWLSRLGYGPVHEMLNAKANINNSLFERLDLENLTGSPSSPEPGASCPVRMSLAAFLVFRSSG